MPRKKKQLVVVEGEGLKDVLKSINKFLRKTKIISKVANVASVVGVPFASNIGKVANIAGYGVNLPGAGLNPSGSGLMVPGQRRMRRTPCKCVRGAGKKKAPKKRAPKKKAPKKRAPARRKRR